VAAFSVNSVLVWLRQVHAPDAEGEPPTGGGAVEVLVVIPEGLKVRPPAPVSTRLRACVATDYSGPVLRARTHARAHAHAHARASLHVQAGSQFPMQTRKGSVYAVTVPEGLEAGQTMRVQLMNYDPLAAAASAKLEPLAEH
jgi:hypothetical protein